MLANELAEKLNDKASLPFYLACTKKYSHRMLKEVLAHVLAVPDGDIWKSRGALFTSIIINQEPYKVPDEEYEGFCKNCRDRYDDSRD